MATRILSREPADHCKHPSSMSNVKKKKKIEVNNRMGKTRDSLKKIGDTKGIFPARMHTVKNRNEKDLTEAEGEVARRTKHKRS